MVKLPASNPAQSATSKRYGVSRFATSVEAADSNNDELMISPSNLSSAPAASATSKGVVELATDAEAQAKTDATRALTPSNLAAEGFLQYADVTMTSAQVKALETTQIELVPAQGAGTVIKFMGAQLKLDYGGTNAFTEAGDNLAVKYTDDSGAAVSQTIETTGFIDQTADTYTTSEPKIDAIAAATAAENQALVMDNLGSAIAGNAAGDNTLVVRTFYQVMSI